MRSISSGNPDANHCCATAQSSTHAGYIHLPEHKKNLLDSADFMTAIPVLCRKIVLDEDCPGDGTNKKWHVWDRSSVGILVLLVFSQRFPRFEVHCPNSCGRAFGGRPFCSTTCWPQDAYNNANLQKFMNLTKFE